MYIFMFAAFWRLIDCLTIKFKFNNLTIDCQYIKVNLCQLRGGKLAQAVKNSQRDTMHIPYVTR